MISAWSYASMVRLEKFGGASRNKTLKHRILGAGVATCNVKIAGIMRRHLDFCTGCTEHAIWHSAHSKSAEQDVFYRDTVM